MDTTRYRGQSTNKVRYRQSLLLIQLGMISPKGKNQGATLAIALLVALAVIAGTAYIARRSFDGLTGAGYQGQAKDARLTAEAGTAFIISEWNLPPNRRLYTGLPMAAWSSSKNRCTAPPKFTEGSGLNPTSAATSFANGNEVSLPSSSTNTSRTFKLISAEFTEGTDKRRGNSFITPGDIGSSPVITPSNPTGFLKLVVEGRIYRKGSQDPIATSIVTREFIVEPKCCNRSFGRVNKNVPDLGNDLRSCAGQSDLPIGDLAIITGLGGGGGLTQNSDSRALRIVDSNNNKLESITCVRPEDAGSGICDYRQDDLGTRNGTIDYEIKPITIPSPPNISAGKSLLCGTQPNCLSQAMTIGAGQTISSSNPNGTSCYLGQYPPGSKQAYHCIVSAINLSGNGNTLTVDTTSWPVYLYLQQGSQNINVGGQASIIHRNGGANASISMSDRLQIRGIPSSSNSLCPSSQDFNLFGNASTAMFIWAPCANTNMKGTTNFGGIIWTNNLDFSGGGTGSIRLAIPSSPGTCIEGSSEIPCRVLEDIGPLPLGSAPIDWAARSINFTRFF